MDMTLAEMDVLRLLKKRNKKILNFQMQIEEGSYGKE
jgi:hypothetical protein